MRDGSFLKLSKGKEIDENIRSNVINLILFSQIY